MLTEKFKDYSPEIFSGFHPKLKGKYVTNTLLKLDPKAWSLPEISLGSKIDENRKLSAGPKKQALLSKLSDAGDHCTFMKDIWRNTASHTRKPYIRDEALAAFGRVNEFMNFLAQALSAEPK